MGEESAPSSQTDVDILRRMMEEGSLMNNRIGGMTPEDRREYILNVLMTKVRCYRWVQAAARSEGSRLTPASSRTARQDGSFR